MAGLLGFSTLQAAPTRTWSGLGTDFLWSDTANWSGTVANGDNLTFAGATRANTPGPDNTTITSVGNISFSVGAGAFTINGTGFTTTSGATITNNSTTLQTIQNTITLAGNSTWTETGTGGLTFTGNINLTNGAGSHTLTVSGGAATSITGIIANGGTGTGSLTKSGTGTLTLSGASANTYTGATNVTAGTLIAAKNAALGTGAATTMVSSGATLAFQGGINYATVQAVSVSGTGAAGSNGAIDNTSGTNSFAGPVTMTGNTTMGAASGSQLTLSGVIGGTGLNLTKAGTGTLTLSGAGANTYSGTTTIGAGTLVAAKNAALGTGAGLTTVSSGATLAFQGGINYATVQSVFVSGTGAAGSNGAIDNISGNDTFAGPITMTAATTMGAASGTQLTLSGIINDGFSGFTLTKAGTGTLTLANANTYTGNTTISAGTLQVGGSGSLGSGAYAGAIANSGTLEYSSSANQILSGIISGTGGLTKDTSTASILTLSGANNTFTGATNISKGTLTAGAVDVLKNSSGVTVASGATLNLNGFATQTINNLNNSGTLNFAGGETLTLTGTNNFLGGSTITTSAITTSTLTIGTGATLTFNASFDDPNLNIILAGGTLKLNGSTDVFGGLTINGTGTSTIDFDSTGNSTLTVSDVTFGSTGTLSITNWADAQDYFYSKSTPGAQGVAPTNQIVFTGFSGNSTKWLSSDHEITPVPEPATYGVLFTAAALGLFFWLRLKASTPRLVPVRVVAQYKFCGSL